MAEKDEIQEIHDLQEEPWEERTLNFLHDSEIDQDLANEKVRKRGGKKHKMRHMRRPMAIPLVILELQDKQCRESALRCLSTFLLEKREEDPDNYYRTGCLVYNSCSTMAILLQEVLEFFGMIVDENPNIRAAKRLANVLTLFQCIAANKETRQKFVKSLVPNYLVPLVLFKTPLEVYENVRAVALSVIGILCQARERMTIQWAVDSNMVEVCWISIEIGNELSKVIGMHILEAIMQDGLGISYICSSACEHLLKGLMKTWEHLVTVLAVGQDFSPRLLYHIIRCYVLLCNHSRGFSMVMESLPHPLADGSFNDVAEEFPVIGSVLQQLLLTVSKVDDCPLAFLPHDLHLY
ncbi:uncharacterized protein LOC131146381 [Malania oleifera]|uniref:uncharacterized protein LOC131146381 n=1 Tax=Malania oleifera TaxID=397392 RepID=UPI0025AE3F20|nr:uncharacterized protein LOC131146381 [Malania oleifera]